MKHNNHSTRLQRKKWRIDQRGMTLMSTTMGVFIGIIALGGGWMALDSYKQYWKVAAAERVMDQYGAAAMQELTNLLCWSWGADPGPSGGHSTRWYFVMDDVIEENGPMQLFEYRRDRNNMLQVSFASTRGLLINGSPPKWAEDRYRSYYQWMGSRPSRGRVKDLNQHDRMTMESMTFELPDFAQFQIDQTDILARIRRHQVVKVEFVMQYWHDDTSPMSFRLFGGDSYIRERKFSTFINMRNWDVERNPFRDVQMGLGSSSGSGGS